MAAVLIGMVGDLLADTPNPDDGFDQITSLLAAPDVLFGNMEGSYSDDPQVAPSGATPLFPARRNLDALVRAGFHVLSLANNHIVDAGHAAMLENREVLRSRGVETCGAGSNLDDARKPAVVQAGDLNVAFLAYASVFPMGYEARSNVPGLAPMRGYNLWREAFDNYHLPGTPPRAQTVPDQTDLAHLAEDIAKARQQADVVCASFHWGDFMLPYHLTDHEIRTARWCIDQGVDMVIGHHHHALRGMEWYKGKPILYGLGHFVFHARLDLSQEIKDLFARIDTDNYGIGPREGWPLLPLHPDTRMTAMALAWATSDGVQQLAIVPCRLRPDGRVVAVDPDDSEGREVIDYLERCISTQQLNGRVVRDGDPLVVDGHRAVQIAPKAESETR